jgi:hypothetical protein
MTRRRLVFGAAGVLLFVLGAVAFTALRTGPAGPSAQRPLAAGVPALAFEPLPPLAEIPATRLFEDDAYLQDFIERHGPAAATIAVRDLAETAGVTHCHDRAHQIGRMAYDLFGAQAFAFAGHSCKSGAMHGVTESFLSERGTQDLAADVELLCATVVRDFFRHQCVHGVGHGLLGWVSYELPEALEFCDGLGQPADRESCYSGVFMENISGSLAGGMAGSEMEHAGAHHHADASVASSGGASSGENAGRGSAEANMVPETAGGATPIARNAQYLRPDDPHYPCTDVEERYVNACYSVQTYHMLTVYDNDFGAVANECSSLATASLQDICFSSLGRDVGNNFIGNPAGAIATCDAIQSAYRLNCLEEVVQDWFWEESSAGVALDFCGRLTEDFDEGVRCYWQIAWRGSDLYATPQHYRTFCGKFDQNYAWLCDFVLFQRLDQFGPQGRVAWTEATPAELKQIWEVCGRAFEDAYCEITLFQQMEAVHRSQFETANGAL